MLSHKHQKSTSPLACQLPETMESFLASSRQTVKVLIIVAMVWTAGQLFLWKKLLDIEIFARDIQFRDFIFLFQHI